MHGAILLGLPEFSPPVVASLQRAGAGVPVPVTDAAHEAGVAL
jgi:hypothetical protein